MAQTPTVAAIIDAGGVEQYAAREGIAAEVMCGVVHRLRAVYDLSFGVSPALKSSTRPRAASSRSNSAGPNSSWRIFSLLIYSRGKPVRVVLVKARQWGGSTVTQMLMAWVQIFHRSGWNSVIVSDVEEQSRTIRSMYSRMALRHPVEICPVRFCNFEGSSKNKMLVDRDCVVSIGSMPETRLVCEQGI